MASGVDRICNMVDMFGCSEAVKKYGKTVMDIVPLKNEDDKQRYWTMYYRIANAFMANPKVTDKKSIIDVMFAAPKTGLNPDPVHGEIYFIPYAGKLTFQIGYKGMVRLSMNSGLVKDIRTGRVFENDFFEYWEDERGQHFKHIVDYKKTIAERGKEILCYSIFDKGNGCVSFHPMETEHIDSIKKMVLSRTPKSPWSDDLFEPEMRKKTVLRRHWKTQPKSDSIAYAIEAEETYERGETFKQNHPEIEEIMDEIIDKTSDTTPDDPIGDAFDNDLKEYTSKL